MAKKEIQLRNYLVLNQYMLELFGVASFEELVEPIEGKDDLEELDEHNVSQFANHLAGALSEDARVTADEITEKYDDNIVGHTNHINKRRLPGEKIRWKYFQYVALLFAEIYLDRYFRNPEGLLGELNTAVKAFNDEKSKEKEKIALFTAEDLTKLSFWMATGAGKTLVMHVNILQYRHYVKKHGRGKKLDNVILVTTGEDLSDQHLKELHASNIEAETFSKQSPRTQHGMFERVEIIEIHKLKEEEEGEDSVAVDAFEGHNLVLVDEGHRGTAGDSWLNMRNRLARDGFCFEYSATYMQAVSAQNSDKAKYDYAGHYGKSIIIDYGYKYFYDAGYGKDYRILNFAEKSTTGSISTKKTRQLYLTAWLMSFYQQMRYYEDHNGDQLFEQFNLHRPLALLVGWRVKTVRRKNGEKVSDVLDLVLFLGRFLQNREESIANLGALLDGKSGLLDADDRDIFTGAFDYLFYTRKTPEEIYVDLLKLVFNCPSGSTRTALHVERASDEIHLRAGNAEVPLGLIYVDDAAKFHKLCDEKGGDVLVTSESEFVDTLFEDAREDASPLNILIGSKKFIEGWSSWRVSTIGLLNMARTKGAQAIQLFGRGVRLKGYDFGLKRSSSMSISEAPDDLRILETLNIFGVNADYMEEFKTYLESEGLETGDNDIVAEIDIPVNVKKSTLEQNKLKTIGLKDDKSFATHGPKMTLAPPSTLDEDGHDATLRRIRLSWYPKIEGLVSEGTEETLKNSARYSAGTLRDEHLAFLNFNKLYFDIRQYKAERAYHRMTVTRSALREILDERGWYELEIPPHVLQPTQTFRQVQVWQEIATALLKKYVAQFYKYHQALFEKPRREYQPLTIDDPNFTVSPAQSNKQAYRVVLKRSAEKLKSRIETIKAEIELVRNGDTTSEYAKAFMQRFEALNLRYHMFEPLLYLSENVKREDIFVQPKPINDGERQFITDLKEYWEENRDQFDGMALHLLRNRDRVGVGFVEGGNFYPDFIMWLVDGAHQYITFVDPKGIAMLHQNGIEHDKFLLAERIKEVEAELDDPSVTLNSFIVSRTPYADVQSWRDPETRNKLSIDDFNKRNVLFMNDNKMKYIEQMFDRILGRQTADSKPKQTELVEM